MNAQLHQLTSRFVAASLLTLQTGLGAIALPMVLIPQPVHASQSRSADAARIYDQTKAAIVYIETKMDNGKATGSGVIVRSNGLIMTNAHVIQGANKIFVELSNGHKIEAKIVSLGKSGCVDLALIQIPGQHNLPTLPFASMSSVSPGQSVFVMGFPQHIKPVSITQGIISNIHKQEGLIQLDAPVNHGNSGGALLNSRGELIGINTWGMKDSEGLNFAVSVDRAQAVLQAQQNQLSPTLARYLNFTSGNAVQLVSDRPMSGSLHSDDQLVCQDGSLADVYTFQGQANQSVIFEMASHSLKPFMMLFGPNGKLLAQTEANDPNAIQRLYNLLPTDGTYTLIANSQQANQFGAYQLRAIKPLLFRTGELQVGDPVCMKDGSRCRAYDFPGKAGQAIAVNIGSQGFQPYVVLMSSDGTVLWKGEWKTETSVDLKLPKDDQYRVIISTVNPQAVGSFSVAIEPHSSSSNQLSRN